MHEDDPEAPNSTGQYSKRRSALLVSQLIGRRGPAPGLLLERRYHDRRRHSLWAFLYGGLRPRRRNGRRHGDEHRIFVDWHEPRVLYLALGIVLMSCADALFTLNLLAVGGEEINAFMRAMIGRGVRWFLWVKIGLTAMSIVVLVAAAKRRFLGFVPVVWLIRLLFGCYLTLIAWEIYLLGWHVGGVGEAAAADLSHWLGL